MKAVMLSIQPKWCEKIANGEKTVEVRKTRPKLETPFKCYIYMTKEKDRLVEVVHKGERLWGDIMYQEDTPLFVKTFDKDSLVGSALYSRCGKIIGGFVCDYIDECVPDYNPITRRFFNYCFYDKDGMPLEDCLTDTEKVEYGNGEMLYGWHISDLKIYDTPRDLTDFYSRCTVPEIKCKLCDNCYDREDYYGRHYAVKKLLRPPQSWCYVEEK